MPLPEVVELFLTITAVFTAPHCRCAETTGLPTEFMDFRVAEIELPTN